MKHLEKKNCKKSFKIHTLKTYGWSSSHCLFVLEFRMNEIISIVWVGFVGVFVVGKSVHSFTMVDDIIVIFNGFDNHLHHPQPQPEGSGSLWVWGAGSALA